ncbi:MAG: hypothetical protein HKN79_01485 [Flavobacteriales bacterium]|nr:hypothetical protein [Flavobacteriales bacterium]
MIAWLGTATIHAQETSTLRSLRTVVDSAGIQLDSLIVLPRSLHVSHGDSVLADSDFLLSVDGIFSVIEEFLGDSLTIHYRVLDLPYQQSILLKDTSIIREAFNYEDPFAYRPGGGSIAGSLLQLDGFEKRGSISRGIQVGNAQDLSVSSDLDLQLSGKLTDRISLLANISDDNIPIQADGSTQQLQEFDQVYIKLFDARSALTAGDYQIASGPGYFSEYLKKARGALFETSILGKAPGAEQGVLGLRAGAAVSRGRFARNVIQGVEGNQGPYKLRGADNELFVIILSGTERVYIDGRLVQRGKEFDYVIDYNAAEITFTANRLITKDRRIVVEFQYAEQNYARSLLQTGADYQKGKWKAYLDVYSEQDAKNQPLQQDLDDRDRLFLSQVGDDVANAFIIDVDSVPYTEDQVLYTLRDSLGYDTVYVYSTDPDEARLQVSFTRVGSGNGDYVQDEFTSNGRVFRWVPPDTIDGNIIRQGDYIPGQLLITPKSQQLLSSGLRYAWNKDSWMDIEGAMSANDLNRFSSKDAADDIGTAFRWRAQTGIQVDSMTRLVANGLVEFTGHDFKRIERYRAVEFERNWNITEVLLDNDQLQTRLGVGVERAADRRIYYGLDRLQIGGGYEGYRQDLNARWDQGDLHASFKGSLLNTSGDIRSRFERHISDISYGLGKVRVGFKDDRENNRFLLGGDTLSSTTYRWYEWEAYVGSNDTSRWAYRLFFKNRDDWRPQIDRQLRAAHAEEYGLELANGRVRNHSVKVVSAWRTLEIVREEAIDQSPEETFLGRLEYRGKWLQNIVQLNTFYEVGSGLERRRQFIYLEVPAGQGVYVWVDYDGDGVRDLDEFEIAQFEYEANFIRVFTPTDDFEKVFSNQVSQTLRIDPGVAWRTKEGIRRFLARFSDQAAWRADRRTREEEGSDAFNPFIQNLNDTVLLSLNNSFRNSIFFNKTDPVWSVDHLYSDVKNKQLLTNGFESRSERENRLSGRYTWARKYTLRLSLIEKDKGREASYSTNRNFDIQEYSLVPRIEWQPDKTFRMTLNLEYTERDNRVGDGESAVIERLGAEARWSQLDKGSINATLNFVQIDFVGNENSSLAFEMLDGLRPGENFTWSLFVQRNLSKNLALNVNYNGRSSRDNPVIHSGGVQVRAFF